MGCLKIPDNFKDMLSQVMVTDTEKADQSAYEFKQDDVSYRLSGHYADGETSIYLLVNDAVVAEFIDNEFTNSHPFGNVDLSPIFNKVITEVIKKYNLITNERLVSHARDEAYRQSQKQMVLGILSKLSSS